MVNFYKGSIGTVHILKGAEFNIWTVTALLTNKLFVNK